MLATVVISLAAAVSNGRAEEGQEAPQNQGETKPMYIQEYRVIGAKILPAVEVEEAVYPFLGPGRTSADVEKARAALEKAYQDKGFQTVQVQIPEQHVKRGIVLLEVVENKVGRLRVKGSRYFALDKIKAQVPSLAEGKVPNFNDVTREVVSLNGWSDRRVTPTLRPGVEPGTVDIDLNVKDTFPLHGSVELNNRYSADTTQLRVNGSMSYNNLWQLGHSAGGSFQVSPQDLNQVQVYSGYYIARFASIDWLSLMVQGVKQNSNVSTLGSLAVAGRGEVIGARALLSLPPRKDFYQSASVGMDYKHFEQEINVAPTGTGATATAASSTTTPISYYPISLSYTGTWIGKKTPPKDAGGDDKKQPVDEIKYTTDLNMSVNLHLRGMGSKSSQFDDNRFNADGNYIYFRGDLSHTQKLPWNFELFGKVQGQIADQPLVSSEQYGGGGLGTVRGYREAEVLGDNGGFGTVELRLPSLIGWWGRKDSELVLYGFAEGGVLTMRDPLPEQTSSYRLASVGFGGRMKLFDYLNGSVDLALPLITQTTTQAHNPFLSFRVWADF